ncbi:MAG TPA: prepilin peptidase [Gemmataceae bacterium]|jgi:leader peptidase (prepilin peptidase)/N-methyltransferase|nr:prepilin peptidase [Gemmataceae bacterium]
MYDFLIYQGPVIVILVFLFILGTIIGSLLNVCIARLPREKSIIWPGSRCGKCFQPIRWYDNLPLVSYWILRGRCRSCGASFSIRYFLIEGLVGIAFVGLFYVEVIHNQHEIPAFRNVARDLQFNLFDRQTLPYFVFFLQRATLFCLLLTAAICDLEDRTIPLTVTLPGTLIGLIFAVAFPWPWPNVPGEAMPLPVRGVIVNNWWMMGPPKPGLSPWPAWGPPPAWAPAGSWQLGLLTGVAGALAGTFLLRAVKFLFEKGLGKEALGLGDADLMMMVGAFLGWQVVVVAFLIGAMASLFLALPQLIFRGDNSLPFGPGLAVGTLITWLCWKWIGPGLQPLLFNETLLLALAGGSGVVLFLLALMMRVVRPAAKPTG